MSDAAAILIYEIRQRSRRVRYVFELAGSGMLSAIKTRRAVIIGGAFP